MQFPAVVIAALEIRDSIAQIGPAGEEHIGDGTAVDRHPDMHQTAKGKQGYFGVKAHIGVDSRTKLVHTALASAAKVADASRFSTCCTGKKGEFEAISYRGHKAAIRAAVRRAKDFYGSTAPMGANVLIVGKAANRRKSGVRVKVEHVLGG